jgi:hypothetical protein
MASKIPNMVSNFRRWCRVRVKRRCGFVGEPVQRKGARSVFIRRANPILVPVLVRRPPLVTASSNYQYLANPQSPETITSLSRRLNRKAT